MLEKSFSLLFYQKKAAYEQKGQVHIYMRITIDGKRKEVSTLRKPI